MLHSFSVFEIQKMRNNLKASKSYPHDLKEKVDEEAEDEREEVATTEEVKRNKDVQSQKQSVKSAPSPLPVDFVKKPESQLINVRLGIYLL